MPQRSRKLIGIIILVGFIIGYALAAMVVGAVLLDGAPEWARLAYYITAGLIWTVPAMVVIRWMQRVR